MADATAKPEEPETDTEQPSTSTDPPISSTTGRKRKKKTPSQPKTAENDKVQKMLKKVKPILEQISRKATETRKPTILIFYYRKKKKDKTVPLQQEQEAVGNSSSPSNAMGLASPRDPEESDVSSDEAQEES